MRALCEYTWKLTVVAGFMLALVGCSGSEEAMVTIRYTLEPTKGLPPGLTQVAIMPAELGPATDPKWSDITSEVLAGLIEESRERFGTNLRVADRSETRKVFDESDLSAAGLTSGEGGMPARLLDVQAFLISKVNIKSEQTKTKKTVISSMDVAAFRHGGGGGADTREAEKINQTITAQATFQLLDAKTGETWVRHEGTVQSNEETDPGFFMGIGGNSDLSTADEIAGVLVERVAREFMAKLVPGEVSHEIEVKSSGNEHCAAGVALMRAEMFREALEKFEFALAEDPSDDRALYASGVACEALGDYDRALTFYKRAYAAKDRDVYADAKQRLEAVIGQIKRAA